MKKYTYTYQTKNLINNKTYIGVHSTNVIDDGYIGCGINKKSSAKSQVKRGSNIPFVNAVSKYGYDNFKKEILSFYETEKEAYEEEEFLVDEKWVKCKDNYNLKIGGFYGGILPKLIDYKNDINKMFSNGKSYEEISKKYNTTKGSWIHLVEDESFLKRKQIEKKYLYGGKKLYNTKGYTHKISYSGNNLPIGLTKKQISALFTGSKKSFNGWFSDFNLFKKVMDNNSMLFIDGYGLITTLELKDIGIKNFCKNTGIPIPSLEQVIYNKQIKSDKYGIYRVK